MPSTGFAACFTFIYRNGSPTCCRCRSVYQGLISSCSHTVAVGEERSVLVDVVTPPGDGNADFDVMNDARTVTYKDYLPLWSSVMGCSERREVLR